MVDSDTVKCMLGFQNACSCVRMNAARDYPGCADRVVIILATVPVPIHASLHLAQTLRDQRMAVKKVGDLERRNGMLSRKPEDEDWGEEAGRRWVKRLMGKGPGKGSVMASRNQRWRCLQLYVPACCTSC